MAEFGEASGLKRPSLSTEITRRAKGSQGPARKGFKSNPEPPESKRSKGAGEIAILRAPQPGRAHDEEKD